MAGAGPRVGIGEVVRRLREEFADVTVSKVRFLEAEGLISPQRTPSGYRRFTTADVDRLRYVLAAQRDRYLPLRVIREHLDMIERGLQPPETPGEPPTIAAPAPAVGTRTGSPDAGADASEDGPLLTADELAAASGLDPALLDELRGYGLLAPSPATGYFDTQGLEIARAAAQLAAHGLEPRHLRAFKTAAEREAGLVDQVIAPLARARDVESREQARPLRAELLALAARLHAALLTRS